MVALFVHGVAILGDSVVLHIRRGDRDNLGVIFLYLALKHMLWAIINPIALRTAKISMEFWPF